ncbi:MAG: chromosome segregation protein SMC [Chromatiales bacterium]|jgi:chromosome segregation protein|nr:chromosome segregation protein SMC [Chromatiales bacterium]
MRLSKIKLAGFKSFVDPTTVNLPGNLSGIVGPNGCGKSNVIDAVRWVMGETSARNLRGDSMDDVIFNGSGTRKPVGSASVELFFDNSSGTIGGQFASYAEISIRRTVSRDGQSQYFLNNVRCRRKDITNLFLGTGLGPRSYAIIEQGMVSRLVEARPEDLRIYIEEAAGISKYKERRRETENRMQHTRDNLARLNDLRDEVEKQIRHLQRQAQVAEKYRGLKQQERDVEAELLAIRLGEIDRLLAADRLDLGSQQTELEAIVAGQRQAEADIERARAAHVEASDAFTTAQAAYYALQSEISRLEQALAHGRELRDRQQQDLDSSTIQLDAMTAEIERDQAALEASTAALAGFEPQLAAAREAQQVSAGELARLEAALDAWQERWTEFNLDVKEQQQQQQLAETRRGHLQSNRERLARRAEAMDAERAGIALADIEARLAAQLGDQESASAGVAGERERLAAVTGELGTRRSAEQQVSAAIENLRGSLESRRGRLQTLEAVQGAALGNQEAVLGGWLSGQDFGERDRLVHSLEVEAGWERAVETVLGDFLQAFLVPASSDCAGNLPDTTVALVDRGAPGRPPRPGTLAARLGNAGALQDLLESVVAATTLDEALALRGSLAAGQSVITPDGVWLGPGWVRISRSQRYGGVIAREHEIRALSGEVATAEAELADLAARRVAERQRIVELEAEQRDCQARVAAAERRSVETAGAAQQLRQELARAQSRLAALADEWQAVQGELAGLDESLVTNAADHEAASSRLAALEGQREAYKAEQEQLLGAYNAAREQADRDQAAIAALTVEYESRRATHDGAARALERVLAQRGQVTARITSLQAGIEAAAAPLAATSTELDAQLARQAEVQQEQTRKREALEALEIEVRSAEARRHDGERKAAARREAVDALRLRVREAEIRREALAERMAATGCTLAEVKPRLPADADATQWDSRLAALRASIEKLGSINLAAIDEFAEQTERKTYLDAQYADLAAALETLEQAIRKIDRETRTRFQETFENINSGLQRLFPRLFGGGHAYLSLEGDEVLSAGVTLMARPPGKRNSHIHLLSGGEKALTAVALIFSIFELNPAPFCLLDEVDAPLDEANVGRFSEIVRDMSQRVQFIVITHNKTTMEMLGQLTGVTMNEPGVSRLVSVDIDEAVKLAAV